MLNSVLVCVVTLPGGRNGLELETMRMDYRLNTVLTRGAEQEEGQERMKRGFKEEGLKKVNVQMVLDLVLFLVVSIWNVSHF